MFALIRYSAVPRSPPLLNNTSNPPVAGVLPTVFHTGGPLGKLGIRSTHASFGAEIRTPSRSYANTATICLEL
jgi:hypothetical protein